MLLALFILSLFKESQWSLGISAQDQEVVTLLGRLSQLSLHVDPGSQSDPSHPFLRDLTFLPSVEASQET